MTNAVAAGTTSDETRKTLLATGSALLTGGAAVLVLRAIFDWSGLSRKERAAAANMMRSSQLAAWARDDSKEAAKLIGECRDAEVQVADTFSRPTDPASRPAIGPSSAPADAAALRIHAGH